MSTISKALAQPLADFWVATVANEAAQLTLPPSMNAAFGAVSGIFAGICLALFLDLLDGVIRVSSDTTRFAGLISIASVQGLPETGSESVVVRQDEYGTVSDTYPDLLRNLAFMGVSHPLNMLLIAPAGAEENAELRMDSLDQVGVNLAISHALAGTRTLLVDANWSAPTLEARFGLPRADRGLFTSLVAAGHNPSAGLDAIRPTPVPGLSALPVGPLPPNLDELAQSPLLEQLLTILTANFDRIVVLAPAQLHTPAGQYFAACMDGALVVARVGATTGRELADTAQALRRANCYLAGAALVSEQLPHTHSQGNGAQSAEPSAVRDRAHTSSRRSAWLDRPPER